MITVIEQPTTGFTITDPDKKKSWKTSVTGFVDDTRLFTRIPRHLPQNIPTALQYLQQASQYWEHILHFFQRETVIRKVRIYIMSWIFHEDGTITIDTHLSYTLPITSSNIGLHTEIKELQTDEPMTYLGYTSQLDGNHNPRLITHTTKAKEFARLISTSSIARHQVYTSSQNIVNSTLTSKWSLCNIDKAHTTRLSEISMDDYINMMTHAIGIPHHACNTMNYRELIAQEFM